MDTDVRRDVIPFNSRGAAASPLACQVKVICALSTDVTLADVIIKCLCRRTFLRATLPQAGKLFITRRSSVGLGSTNSCGRSSRGRSHGGWRGRSRHRSRGCSCRLRRRLLLRDRCRHRSRRCRRRSSCVVVGCGILVFRHCAKTDFLSLFLGAAENEGRISRQVNCDESCFPTQGEKGRKGEGIKRVRESVCWRSNGRRLPENNQQDSVNRCANDNAKQAVKS